MRLGVIGGTNASLELMLPIARTVSTEYGDVRLTTGSLGATEVAFVARHGVGHPHLSSSVPHRANIRAFADAGVEAIVATTVCGIVDPGLPLATAILFDDLLFPDNRLPDGSPCTFFDAPGDPRRGHLIWGSPFSSGLRGQVMAAAHATAVEVVGEGVYAYVLGPRFNTPAEVRWLARCGAIAVSQTAGPEAVLAAELEIPYALVGFGVDWANGVQATATPVDELNANIAASRAVFGSLLTRLAENLTATPFDTGFVYRIEG